MTFSLAHLSDPHLPLRPEAIQWRALTGKQALALLSWRRKRRHAHTAAAETALLADVAAHTPDHLALTGDLANLAAASEFEDGRAWLQRLAPPARLSVVPGNHDLTIGAPWQKGIGQWAEWMQSDPGAGWQDAPFPFLRRRGPLALIGLSSAVPTPLGSASGLVGGLQRRRLEALLQQAGRDRLFRVLLIHHPPVMGEGGPRKALRDRAALCAVLRRRGAELVLHGHHHVTSLAELPGPHGTIPVCGVPSALATPRASEIAGWRLYTIDRDGAGWRLNSYGRQHDPATGRFRQSGAWTMRLERDRA